MNETRARLESVCANLVEKAIQVAKEVFPSCSLPTRDFLSIWHEPTADGNYRGESHPVSRLDLDHFWNECHEKLEHLEEWNVAISEIEAYESATGAPVEDSFWGTKDAYCRQLIEEYFRRVGRIDHVPEIQRDAVEELVRHCESATDSTRVLLALEDFRTDKPFSLGDYAAFRLISQSELEDFGEIIGSWPHFLHRPTPRTDWWICEIRATGRKGSAEAWNRAGRLDNWVTSALRTFKAGKLTATALMTTKVGPYGRNMKGFGPERILSRRGSEYSLTEPELEAFQHYWPRFRALMEDESSYLHLSRRRLEIGGERANQEDSLVDHIIGMESLLSKDGESTEIRYRLSVRGAVAIASSSRERGNEFKGIRSAYDARSAIVHGRMIEQGDLDTSADFAEEALRKCWRWYFDNWVDKTTNEPAIEQLDETLLAPA